GQLPNLDHLAVEQPLHGGFEFLLFDPGRLGLFGEPLRCVVAAYEVVHGLPLCRELLQQQEEDLFRLRGAFGGAQRHAFDRQEQAVGVTRSPTAKTARSWQPRPISAASFTQPRCTIGCTRWPATSSR